MFNANGKVYVICPESQTIVRVDPMARTVAGAIPVGGRIVSAALSADQSWLALAVSHPEAVVLFETSSGRIATRVALPATARTIAASGSQLAVVMNSPDSAAKHSKSLQIARIAVPGGSIQGILPFEASSVADVSYRKDGETFFAAIPDSGEIVSFDSASGALLARLPVPIRPARFCVDGTGGQVFVTGLEKEPQLAIFSPYQNQIDQTLYAGRSLFGMAVAPNRNLLFLSNPDSGDVTIMDIDTRKVMASIRTGGTPGEILIPPAEGSGPEEYALVVDSGTGDVSVLRIPTVLNRGSDALIAQPPKPVFAVFHGGGGPQSAAIVPYEV